MIYKILFADDTTVYTSSASLPLLYKDLNADLFSLGDWFCANKLFLNVGKSHYVIFHRSHVYTDLEINIGNNKIERKPHVKFLGITMNEKLDWSEHTKNCNAKISSALYAIDASKKYLTADHLSMLYNVLIYPYIAYGILLWGSTFQKYTNKIVMWQKRAMRIIAHAPYNSHTSGIFQQFKLLKFSDVYNLHLGKYMYQQINKMHPEPLLRHHALCHEIHTYNTRQSNLLHLHSRRTAFVSNSLIHKGPDYWNTLPESIKHSSTVISFNRRHKSFLLDSHD